VVEFRPALQLALDEFLTSAEWPVRALPPTPAMAPVESADLRAGIAVDDSISAGAQLIDDPVRAERRQMDMHVRQRPGGVLKP